MADDSRYEQGYARLKEMQGDAGEAAIRHIAGISPDMARYILEFVFGEIHRRPGLDLKTREIAAVSALTALGNAAPQLRAHIHGALNVGCTEQEVVEIMIQMAAYAGFPAALNGLFAARDVFTERASKSKQRNGD